VFTQGASKVYDKVMDDFGTPTLFSSSQVRKMHDLCTSFVFMQPPSLLKVVWIQSALVSEQFEMPSA
jgi:hypothetical protein